ncbi:RHS repeat-associated core domain-containing protein [Pseudomonas juntendi]|uniref:RHS repeat-associated core domain-containing protein n=2 Tax=Gammaproteobacteria TaxID=1236 RepID=A0ABZ2JDR8_9PSED|nr:MULTISPECIES: RHS repeat-associated core domain-containing protein [Pseudomonas]MDG9874388.1 RHS repeat-associated core domain-containing protein [Pseudomonas juntendi]MDH2017352.1 RHS repeat-associated core domain-containing protein [Pseudomonas juntendi]QDR66428.1 RHS repeat-associated core domain-containing protein [Pseudomonas sp. BJP69]WHL29475.1 RHS repeat-associated core domain-containing protein [Pseudomonas juntendi]
MSNKTNERTEPAYGATGLRLEELSNDNSLLFYQNSHLNTTISPHGYRHIVRVQDTALAQLESAQAAKIMTSDRANSVLGVLDKVVTYSPYGHLDATEDAVLLAFNGQWRDPRTLCYLLGSYRLFSPQLQQFCSPDSFSPFASGGLNTYNYCAGDPINYTDTSGHRASKIFRRLFSNNTTRTLEYRHYDEKTAALRKIASNKNKQLKKLKDEVTRSNPSTSKGAGNPLGKPEQPALNRQELHKKLALASEERKKSLEHYKRNRTKLVAAANRILAAQPMNLSERATRIRFNIE